MFLAGCAFLALQFEKSFTTFFAFFLKALSLDSPPSESKLALPAAGSLTDGGPE